VNRPIVLAGSIRGYSGFERRTRLADSTFGPGTNDPACSGGLITKVNANYSIGWEYVQKVRATWNYQRESANMERHRGQSLVELALVTPILIILILIVADGARVFSANIQIGNAAREGANYASRSYDNAEDILEIRNSALQELGTAGTIFGTAPVVDAYGPSDGCVDDFGYDCVRVTVTYQFDMLFDFPGLPGQINLERSAQMRILEV
jgi:hypothetical protein